MQVNWTEITLAMQFPHYFRSSVGVCLRPTQLNRSNHTAPQSWAHERIHSNMRANFVCNDSLQTIQTTNGFVHTLSTVVLSQRGKQTLRLCDSPFVMVSLYTRDFLINRMGIPIGWVFYVNVFVWMCVCENGHRICLYFCVRPSKKQKQSIAAP